MLPQDDFERRKVMNVPRHGNRRTLPPEEREFLLARNDGIIGQNGFGHRQQHGEPDDALFMNHIDNASAVKVTEVS